MKLSGRTCVFAGATGQIGRGAVKALAEKGMNVVMVTHNPDAAGDVVGQMKGYPGQVIAVSNSVGDSEIFRHAENLFGSVDAVISSTGGLQSRNLPEDISDDKLDAKLHHQITEPFHMVREALPYLKRSRNPRILFVSTVGALDGFREEGIEDSIAGGGVISMTYALARVLADRGITVNCIARGGMINDHTPSGKEDYYAARIEHMIPAGHAGTADEFGALAAYILSEEADYVTGHVFNLTGGLYIG